MISLQPSSVAKAISLNIDGNVTSDPVHYKLLTPSTPIFLQLLTLLDLDSRYPDSNRHFSDFLSRQVSPVTPDEVSKLIQSMSPSMSEIFWA